MMEQRKTGKGSPMGVEDWKRTMRSLGNVIDDPEALAQALEIQAELDATITKAVAGLLGEGYSYTELSAPLKISRQAARARWASKIKRMREERS